MLEAQSFAYLVQNISGLASTVAVARPCCWSGPAHGPLRRRTKGQSAEAALHHTRPGRGDEHDRRDVRASISALSTRRTKPTISATVRMRRSMSSMPRPAPSSSKSPRRRRSRGSSSTQPAPPSTTTSPGPDGVATDGVGTCLFAGDGPSRFVSFQLPSGTQVSDVTTGGTTRADEMAFDPKDRLLLVVNNAETPPFATLISASAPTARSPPGSKIVFNFATNGAEQPAWDPGTQRFYESIPSISGTTRRRARSERLPASIR